MDFHVVNLGCKVNKAESDSFTASLLAKGHHLVDLDRAESIIINTCTVTGDAEKKTRKAVRRALRENPFADVLVTGCAAAIDPDFYTALDPRIRVVEKNELVSSDQVLRAGGIFPLRVSVKVQDGCDHACTYCIVHVARGRAWSRPLDEIVREVKELEGAGIREIMLSGIDLGSYHFDGIKLDVLLATLLDQTEDIRFRISSVEPRSLTDATIELVAGSEGRICRHLHIPLQAGSSKVLSEMNRPYDADHYANLIRKLYRSIPSLSLSTDIIVGFPGECDAEFMETLALAKEARFSKIHAFRYSLREGTPAAARSDQIPASVKEQRLQELLVLAHDLRMQDAQRRIGTIEDVLVEAPGIGMSESYFKVRVPEEIPAGSLLPLALTEVDSSCIMKACKKR